MPTRRTASHVTRLAAIAAAVLPGLTHGQNVPGLEIDSARFVVSTTGPDGERTSRETNRVPLDPHACYSWRLHFSNNAVGEVALREEFELPAPGTWPASDQYEVRSAGRVAVTKSREKPTDGWISNEWCVGNGDPTGKYVITVYVQDRLAKSFEFFVAATSAADDSVIAEVLGRTIRMSQRNDMTEIILWALLDQYAQQRGITATPDEVSALRASGFGGTPEDATRLLQSWKVNQALFRQYGGRVIAQQFGPEPVDAYRDFLKDHERRGSFRILYERLQRSFWSYFVTDSIHTFMRPEEAGRAFDKPWWEPTAAAPAGDLLGELAGDWDLTLFVIGGSEAFGGGPICRQRGRSGRPSVTIAPPSAGAVLFSASCDDRTDYVFRLKLDPGTQAYLITVKSKIGISVDDFPVAYFPGQGWRGARDQLVDGETQSITARVAPIEGRNWRGWRIEVLPTAAIDREAEGLKRRYLWTDLTRRK